MQPYTIALIQTSCSWDRGETLEKVATMIRQAADEGAVLICLQELFHMPYLCQIEDAKRFDFAEPVPGATTDRMAAIAKEKRVSIVVPLFERRAPGVYHNSIAFIDSGGTLAGVYRKMHIPDDPGYYEKFYFTPGDLGFKVFPFPLGPTGSYGKAGTLICWDQWFPEAARLTALQGAELLIYPTAIGWHPEEKESYGGEQREAWQTMQRAHAIANGVYVAAINRIGFESADGGEKGIEFWGSSFLCDPMGKIITKASQDREEIIYGEIDPTRIEDVRRGWPFLRDRRIDAYQDIEKRMIDYRPSRR